MVESWSEGMEAGKPKGGDLEGPCNDLTVVATFLISARFNYTVDDKGVLSLFPRLRRIASFEPDT